MADIMVLMGADGYYILGKITLEVEYYSGSIN